MQHDPRRSSPRIGIEALCWEIIGERERSSLVVDLSTHGARLERPFIAAARDHESPMELGPAGKSRYMPPPPLTTRCERVVPLQIEVPGLDEVMWARGDVVFDEVIPVKSHGGPFGLLRRTGYHIAFAARRDLNRLSDFVWEMHAKQREAARRERERECDTVDWNACFG